MTISSTSDIQFLEGGVIPPTPEYDIYQRNEQYGK